MYEKKRSNFIAYAVEKSIAKMGSSFRQKVGIAHLDREKPYICELQGSSCA